MALDRKVSLWQGLRYKGGGPMWAWILHRLSGISMVVFVGLHVVASFFTQQAGSDWAINVNIVYENPIFQLLVVFAVLYHGLNGMRIIVLDLWPKMLEYQREVTWFQWLIFIPIYGLTIFIIIRKLLAGE